MSNICPICGKEFDPHATSNKPRKYCSRECYRIANIKHVNERKKIRKEENQLEWAKNEADKVARIVITKGGSYLNELADYIYNNYKQRRKANGK